MESEDWMFGAGNGPDDQPLNFEFTTGFNRWMTLPEERALALTRRDLEMSIDPVFITMTMHRQRLLPVTVYQTVMSMFQKNFDRRIIFDYFFKQIPSYVSLQYFVTVLDNCGYTQLSALLHFNSFKWNSEYLVLPSSTYTSSKAYDLYSNLKGLINNAQLDRPGVLLRKMANRCYGQMNKETDPLRKQRLADNCMAIISAETDTIAIRFDKTLCEHVLFKQMKRLCMETSNTLLSDLVCYGRLANAYAIAGDYSKCEQMLDEAKCKAYLIGPCIEFLHLVYIIAYVMLWEFEKCPTPELRSKLLMWCRVGLKCVEEEFVVNRNKWRRILLLRMVFCLLGLGNRTTVIENCPVDKHCILEAKLLLAEFDKYLDGIEKRRKLFYHVAKARLCELENCLLDTLQFLIIAYKYAVEGKFEEQKFIKDYYKKIFTRAFDLKSQPQRRGVHHCQMCSHSNEQAEKSSKSESETIANRTLKCKYENSCNRHNCAECFGTQVRSNLLGVSYSSQNDQTDSKNRDRAISPAHNEDQELENRQPDTRQRMNVLVETETELFVTSLERCPPSGSSNPDAPY